MTELNLDLYDGALRKFGFMDVDTVGHTAIALQNPTQITETTFVRFLDLVESHVHAHSGRTWLIAGDGGVFAFYGDDPTMMAEQAVGSALGVIGDLDNFNAEQSGVHERIRVRIAIHIGDARYFHDTGRIQSNDLNFVSRLQKKGTKEDCVSISDTVYRELPPGIRTRFHYWGVFEERRVYHLVTGTQVKRRPPQPAEQRVAAQLPRRSGRLPSRQGFRALSAEFARFVAGPPVKQPADFFGREGELTRLFSLLRSPLQHASVQGPRRSGKTSLLLHLAAITRTPTRDLRQGQRRDWLSQPRLYRWVFVDFQDPRMRTRGGLLKHLLEGLELPKPPGADLEHFLEVATHALPPRAVILLDEIGAALRHSEDLDDIFWGALRSLATRHAGRLAFVLADRESPERLEELSKESGLTSNFFTIFGHHLILGALTEAAAIQLIKAAPIPFNLEDVGWILEHSGRWPILLQMLCRERLMSLECGETDDSWRSAGLNQVRRFRHLA